MKRMKKTFTVILLGLGLTGPALAQTPAADRPPVEPPGNEEVGIQIDRFIGNAATSPAKISHDTMYVQRILSAGSADTGSAGRVLAPGEETDLATLMPRDVTTLFKSNKEIVFYTESGHGRIDDGKQYWDLSEGIGALVPANLAHRLTASDDQPLKLIMYSFDPTGSPATPKGIVVRNIHKVGMIEHNVHYSHNSKPLFGQEEGMARILVITFAPMTIAGPHASGLNPDPNAGGVQWIHVSGGDMLFQLGSEIRHWPINSGFMNPNNGKTVHARYNIGDTVETTLYISSNARRDGAGGGGRGGRGGQPNPGLPGRPPGQGRLGQIWDPNQIGGLQGGISSPEITQSYIDALVPGTPLPSPQPARR